MSGAGVFTETDGIYLCGHHRSREQGNEGVNIALGYRSINSYTACDGVTYGHSFYPVLFP